MKQDDGQMLVERMKLEFTPLEFETLMTAHTAKGAGVLEFTPLEFETHIQSHLPKVFLN